MEFKRQSGIVLHPTSFPGDYGVGEIGPHARRFVDDLKAMHQKLWQVLPLGPTSYGDSPYQSLSTFAGNHLLISFEDLKTEGLLLEADLQDCPNFPSGEVDYGPVIENRNRVLRQVCGQFEARANDATKADFKAFQEKHGATWLYDYALYVAIKEAHEGRPWIEWPKPLLSREEAALEKARSDYGDAYRDHQLLQFLFFRQWSALRKHCNSRLSFRSMRPLMETALLTARQTSLTL